MKHLLTIATFLLFRTAYAQHTEIRYYDIYHKETSDTASAVYRKKTVCHSPSNDNTGTLSYFTNDTLTTIAHSNDLERKIWHGKVTHYRKNGDTLEICNYKNDLREGESIKYFPNGRIAVKEFYEYGNMLEQSFYTPEGRDTTENLFNRKAIPPIGYNNIITNNLIYPPKAREQRITGRVLVSFIVERDGSISTIKTAEPRLGGGLEEEAIRLISLLPDFTPGIKDGAPIRFVFHIPIDFRLEAEAAEEVRKKRK